MRNYLAEILMLSSLFDLLRLNCIPSASVATNRDTVRESSRKDFSETATILRKIGHVHRRQIDEQFVTFLCCHRCVRRIQYRRRPFVAEQRFETRRFTTD